MKRLEDILIKGAVLIPRVIDCDATYIIEIIKRVKKGQDEMMKLKEITRETLELVINPFKHSYAGGSD